MSEKLPQPFGVSDKPTMKDEAHAPLVYFDIVSNMGHMNGVVNLTLVAARQMLDADNNVITDGMVTAHIRCSIEAAKGLRNAIDNALLLSQPTQGSGGH